MLVLSFFLNFFQNLTIVTVDPIGSRKIVDKNHKLIQYFCGQRVYFLEILSCLQTRRDTTYLSFIKLFDTNVCNSLIIPFDSKIFIHI